MRRYNPTHLWLAAVAILGWALFIMGCTGWPAWNHDGSKILLPYADAKSGTGNIALVDVNANRGRTLYKCPKDLCSVQWMDGERSALVYQVEEDDRSSLISVPIDGVEPPHRIAVLDKETFGVGPLPELEGSVYLYGKPSIRVHLASGNVQTLNEFRETLMLPWSNHKLLYLREKDSGAGLEVGECGAEGTSPRKLFELSKDDAALGSPSDFSPFSISTDVSRSRLAITALHSGYDEVLVYTRAGLQYVIKLKMPPGEFRLGNMQWSRDGKLIFASVFRSVGERKVQWNAAEITPRTGEVRLLPLLITDSSLTGSDDDVVFYLQLSLSPDGRTLAGNGALYNPEHMRPEDRALYLIDVKKWNRDKVAKIPLSAWASSESE